MAQYSMDLTGRIRIYLDMDGVLADFEKGVKELCHMEALSQNGKRSLNADDMMWEAIRDWQEKGGTGILHISAEETVRELEKLDLL